MNGWDAAACYGACASPSAQAVAQVTRQRPRHQRIGCAPGIGACSARAGVRPGLFLPTPSKRPSFNCPSTSGQPGQPKRDKAVAHLCSSGVHALGPCHGGCVLSAFNTSTRAAASGAACWFGGCCSRPKRSAFIAAPFSLLHVAVLAPECLGSPRRWCLDGEGLRHAAQVHTTAASDAPSLRVYGSTPCQRKNTAIFSVVDCVAFIPYSRFSSRCGAGADWCNPKGCCTHLHLFCPAVRIGVCISSHHFAPH